jgi:hypothetical protein
VPARCVWVEDGYLHFGTADGRICRFYKDKSNIQNYSDKMTKGDERTPIHMKWRTNIFYDDNFSMNKNFVNFSLLLGAFPVTSIKVTAFFDGKQRKIVDLNKSSAFIHFENVDFDSLSFSTDNTPQFVRKETDIHSGRVEFLFENDRDEPCELCQMFAQYASDIE